MSKLVSVTVPDIGGASDVSVIEVLVSPGDQVAVDDSLVTLEGDKATMEIPSLYAGEVKEVQITVGDKVSQGGAILSLQIAEVTNAPVVDVAVEPSTVTEVSEQQPTLPTPAEVAPAPAELTSPVVSTTAVHAGPAVRRMAKEFDIDLSSILGTGTKGRVSRDDLHKILKQRLANGGGSGIPAIPTIDFTQFGPIRTEALSRINKLSGQHLHRSWVNVPHVTQFDEADITELEAFRQQQKKVAEKQGFKLTPIVFILKALVAVLKQFPRFNASLDSSGEQLILKQYFHIGVAVDTPQGLVVPVIRDVDQKGVFALAKELGEISVKAREGKLSMTDMQGGCFTVSSLGGIGGTAFTPIVNAPEVGILGIAKSAIKPVYQEGEFVPRLMLPLALSYDHRVIDGAEGARFMVSLSAILADLRRLVL